MLESVKEVKEAPLHSAISELKQDSKEKKASLSLIPSPSKHLQLTSKDKERLKKTSGEVVEVLSRHLRSVQKEWEAKSEKEKGAIVEEMSKKMEAMLLSLQDAEARFGVSMESTAEDRAKEGLDSLFAADSLSDWHEMLGRGMMGGKEVFMTGLGKISFEGGGEVGSFQELFNDLLNKTLQLIIHANHAGQSPFDSQHFHSFNFLFFFSSL